MYAGTHSIWKLCFLIIPCLALPSLYATDGKPTTSSSIAKPPTRSTSSVPVDLYHATRTLTVYPVPFLTTSSEQRSSLIMPQTSYKAVISHHYSVPQYHTVPEHHTVSPSHSVSKHHDGSEPHFYTPVHTDTAFKSTTHSQRRNKSASTTPSRSKETNGRHQTSTERSRMSSIHLTTTPTSSSSKGSPKGTKSMHSERTSTASHFHSSISAHQSSMSTKSSASFNQPESSTGQMHTSTSKKTSSQTSVISRKTRTSSLNPTTKVSKITHPLTQTKIATKPVPLTRTSIGATRSSDADTSQHPHSSKSSGRPKTSSIRSSLSINKGSSAMQTKSTVIVFPTPNRSKPTPEVTHHSNQRSTTSADRTPTLRSKSIFGSTERRKSISTLTEKTTSSSSTGTSTTHGHPKQTTSSISTKHGASSLSSKHQISTVTLRGSKKLSSTGSRVSSASTRHQNSMTTATQGQSAGVPHPTTAIRMKTSSHPIQTIITGSKGTVVTYEATRDPKYTTNTKTTTSTDDHGDRVIIYPGGWRWRPIGLPHLKLPPFKLPPPPASNPDPESGDHAQDHDHDHEHDHDDDKSSKSTTKSAKCTTTRPPRCTKTVSFISTGAGYTR